MAISEPSVIGGVGERSMERCTRSENIFHAYKTGLKTAYENRGSYKPVAILDKTTGKIYESVRSASRELQIGEPSISKGLNGKRNHTHGHVFIKI